MKSISASNAMAMCILLTTTSQLFRAERLAAAKPRPLQGFTPTAQDSIVPTGAQPRLLWAEGEFTEGGAVTADGSVLFSDIGNRIMKFDPRTKRVTVFREPSGRANGMMFDKSGRLIVCEGANTEGNRRLSVTSSSGIVTTLADRWQGKRFNSPNDVCVDRQGRVYFSDPRYVGDEPREIDFEGVFVIDPTGAVRLATRDVTKPNGLIAAPDGNTLYVVDHDVSPDGPRQLLAFKIEDDGTLQDKRILFDCGRSRGMDGLTMDEDGNIYATAGSGDEAGIYVFGPRGEQLAFVALPGNPTNCVFGRREFATTLFILAQGSLDGATERRYGIYDVRLKKPGYHVFADGSR